ncbi:hypothetical protein [Pontibacter oryzae]|uniref:Uncharacterized protein n=1 Tax=Pontibacter oryzae TaxID=2304593 RepID=A0A399SIF0_9BACT|nr:hypothetical protein [Pontibacter oryzae]RIJ42754.1 hypothetical protein D1627_02590 [Pontibacter oryzae]
MKNDNYTIPFIVCLILFLVVVPLIGQAQYRPAVDIQEWPMGKIVLTSGDTIYGPVTYHHTQEIINIQNEDGTLSAFSPVNVKYFIVQEQPSGKSTTFRSLMWDMDRDYSDFKKPTFFEQLNQGGVVLIMRENYIHTEPENLSAYSAQGFLYDPDSYVPGSEWINHIKPLYYLLLPDGEIITLRNVRKDLYQVFGKKGKQVKKYVKDKRLAYEKPHQLVAIVNYFNSL